jgi:hypothetical protein
MCRPATCRTCSKATYVGCGQHVEAVLAGVPAGERCSCPQERRDARPTPGLGGIITAIRSHLHRRP